MKYFLENGPEWGRRSVSGRVSRLLFRQILPPFILKDIVPRELLPSKDKCIATGVFICSLKFQEYVDVQVVSFL
jgi:hypothetical protein